MHFLRGNVQWGDGTAGDRWLCWDWQTASMFVSTFVPGTFFCFCFVSHNLLTTQPVTNTGNAEKYYSLWLHTRVHVSISRLPNKYIICAIRSYNIFLYDSLRMQFRILSEPHCINQFKICFCFFFCGHMYAWIIEYDLLDIIITTWLFHIVSFFATQKYLMYLLLLQLLFCFFLRECKFFPILLMHHSWTYYFLFWIQKTGQNLQR